MNIKDIMKYYNVPERNLSEYPSEIFNTMKTRTDVLNHLAEKYQLKRYLEIGVQNPAQNFDKIKCEYKVSVDPDPNAHATFCMTSDEFFTSNMQDITSRGDVGISDGYRNIIPKLTFDLIFIDGLHTAEQVRKDFLNATQVLSVNGFIVIHDCNPESYERTLVPRPTKTGPWNGDVWKTAINIGPARITIDIDNGCLIWHRLFHVAMNDINVSWDDFDAHRKELLNLISWDEFTKL